MTLVAILTVNRNLGTKRLKLIKPSSELFLSTTATRPIKVADTAPSGASTTRSVVNEIKSLEMGKVTAVAAVMTIFKKINGSLRSTTSKGSYLAPNSKDLVSKRPNRG